MNALRIFRTILALCLILCFTGNTVRAEEEYPFKFIKSTPFQELPHYGYQDIWDDAGRFIGVTNIKTGKLVFRWTYTKNGKIGREDRFRRDGTLAHATYFVPVEEVGYPKEANRSSIAEAEKIQRSRQALQKRQKPRLHNVGMKLDTIPHLIGDGVMTMRTGHYVRQLNKKGQLIFEIDTASGVTTEHHYENEGARYQSVTTDLQGNVLEKIDYPEEEQQRPQPLAANAAEDNTAQYAYDETGQVVDVENTAYPDESFEYDKNGNRIDADSVIGAGNRLLENATHTFQYDAEGNLIKKTEKTTGNWTEFDYDHLNRMVEARNKQADGTLINGVRNTYSVINQLIRREEFGSEGQTVNVRNTIHDGNKPWMDLDGLGSITRRYLPGGGEWDLLARERFPEMEVESYLTDAQGSVQAIVNTDGQVVHKSDYSVFGEVIGEFQPELGDRFKWHGIPYEPVTGMYQTYFRQYDPQFGHFISEDPIRFKGNDTHLYRYSFNNPIIGEDPNGTSVTFGEYLKTSLISASLTTPTYDLLCSKLLGREWNPSLKGFAIGFGIGVVIPALLYAPVLLELPPASAASISVTATAALVDLDASLILCAFSGAAGF